VVLNSEDPAVRDGAIRDLELQAELLDGMGLGDDAVVVLHVGGAAGGHDAAMERFEAGFERLSDRARARLVIENDDRTFALSDVLALHERTGLRVVWDILHHHCNDPDGIPDREALERAVATWPAGVTPKIHFSSPKTAMEERKRRVGRRVERSWVLPQLRAHADMIDPIAFEQFLRETATGLDFDVMLEAKAKDLALLRLRDQLAARKGTVPSPAN
jgi:UV DNA damage endonuclease